MDTTPQAPELEEEEAPDTALEETKESQLDTRDTTEAWVYVYFFAMFVVLFVSPGIVGVMLVPVVVFFGIRFLIFLWDAMFGPGDWPQL